MQLARDVQSLQQKGTFSGILSGAQKTTYFKEGVTYLCLSLARPAYPTPEHNVSMTLGLKITPNLQERIAFLNDPAVQERTAHTTCERCPMTECTDRVAEPTVVAAREKRKAFYEVVQKLEKRGVRR